MAEDITAVRQESLRRGYESPAVTVVGSFAGLTRQKMFNAADGAVFFGVPEGITS